MLELDVMQIREDFLNVLSSIMFQELNKETIDGFYHSLRNMFDSHNMMEVEFIVKLDDVNKGGVIIKGIGPLSDFIIKSLVLF